MKDLVINLTIVFLFAAFGNNVLNAQQMTKGTNVIQAGVGLGGWSTSYSTSQTPLMIATFERGIIDDLGPGNLSVGGSLIYKSGKYVGDFFGWNYTYTALAARGSYHPHFVKVDKLDAYGGLSLGLYHVSTKATSGEIIGGDAGSFFAWGLHLGARYQFTEQIGAWAELGAGVGNVGLGISYKF